MTFATLCSGCGTFDLGLQRAGMTCVYQCELDAQCQSILNRHWPEVPKGMDVYDERTAEELVRLRPRLLAFGSPCQDLSVAGRRGGIHGERSGVFFRCVELAFICEAPVVLWENVPGAFSSNGGEDFATVLEAFTGYAPSVPKGGWRDTGVCIGPLYSVAWCVLDAQWSGVPQRRRRIFLVGHSHDRARPYEILSLADSLPWNPPPRREARARIAASLTSGTASGSGVNKPGRRREDDVNLVNCLDAHMGMGGPDDNSAQAGHLVTVGTLCSTHTPKGHGARGPSHQEAASGRLIPVVAHTLTATATATGRLDPNGETFIPSRREEAALCDFVRTSRFGVRRLLPVECERLQGLPDSWTQFGADGKELSDSARYRMIGNAGAVPVLEYIGERIMQAQAREV